MIYFDNAATTPFKECVKNVIIDSLENDEFANPSSGYKLAKDEYFKIYTARKNILKNITSYPDLYKLYFTSGGTESNNWAIQSVANMYSGSYKNKIISTTIEHPSVYNTLKHLEENGYEVVYVKPNKEGIVSVSDISDNIDERTILVSVMMVNNQTGSIQPIEEIGKICRSRGVLFHSDCVQAVGHIEVDMDRMNIDMMSASAHKFGGMKGTGFLAVNSKYDIENMMYGGKQNIGKRPGTENVIGISSMSEALDYSCFYRNVFKEHISKMRKYIIDNIKAEFIVNGSEDNCYPGIINLGFKNVNKDDLILILEANGIMVSATSACETGEETKNRVLSEMNVPEEYMNGSIRISLYENNSIEECKKFVDTINEYIYIRS